MNDIHLIYLDNHATTPCDHKSEAMMPYLTNHLGHHLVLMPLDGMLWMLLRWRVISWPHQWFGKGYLDFWCYRVEQPSNQDVPIVSAKFRSNWSHHHSFDGT